MFYNKIGYIKLKTIKTGSSKTHFRSRKKFAQVLKKIKTALSHPGLRKKSQNILGLSEIFKKFKIS